jgi:hypothetical protein
MIGEAVFDYTAGVDLAAYGIMVFGIVESPNGVGEAGQDIQRPARHLRHGFVRRGFCGFLSPRVDVKGEGQDKQGVKSLFHRSRFGRCFFEGILRAIVASYGGFFYIYPT